MCQTVISFKKKKQCLTSKSVVCTQHDWLISTKCRMKTEGYHQRNEQTSVCLVEVVQSSLLGTDVTLLEWQIGNDWSNRVFPSSWVIFHMFKFVEWTWGGWGTDRLATYGHIFIFFLKIECPLPHKHGNHLLHKVSQCAVGSGTSLNRSILFQHE